jgi:nicotinamide riboside kinase
MILATRVVVVGNSSSGKSALAREIGQHAGTPARRFRSRQLPLINGD